MATSIDKRQWIGADLNHECILHTALSFVLKDEGFALPTGPAKVAQETAEKILEWSSENKDGFKYFSESLVAALSTCFEDEIMLGRFSKQRERMWSKYHLLRSSESFESTWTTFLESVSCQEAGPIFYQFVTDSVMEQLIKLRFPVVSVQSTDSEVTLDYEEVNAVRYAAGYSVRALMKTLNRTKLKGKEELKKCLQEMMEGSTSAHHSVEWTSTIDRGGLIHVGDTTYSVFSEIELVLRRYMLGKKARDLHLPSAVDIIVKDENVLFAWAIESASWEQDSADVLLRMIAERWVTMRGFSFARSIMELYKQKVKRNIQKSKGVRKQLQKPTAAVVSTDD